MARIFIAIRFDDEFKQELVGLQNALKNRGVEGNYCPYGNLHMTLAFIGEKYDLPEIRKAVYEVAFEPFTITCFLLKLELYGVGLKSKSKQQPLLIGCVIV